jgi:hypothetical protein
VVGGSNEDEVPDGTPRTPSYYRTVSTLAHKPVVLRVSIHSGVGMVGQKISWKERMGIEVKLGKTKMREREEGRK